MYREVDIYFPQDEIHSAFLPVTCGCAHNQCAFCAMYKDQTYGRVPLSDFKWELLHLNPHTEKIFLTGGDPLVIGYESMMTRLDLIRQYSPLCGQVAAYASIASLKRYRVDELARLHDRGLRLLYIGFETGRGDLLRLMKKAHRVEDALEVAGRLNQASLSFDAIVLCGLGGAGEGLKSARLTAHMLNQFIARRIITMNLQIMPGTPLMAWARSGHYLQAGRQEYLEELLGLLEALSPSSPTRFDSTHPTNLLKLKGSLPEDRARLEEEISLALKGMP